MKRVLKKNSKIIDRCVCFFKMNWHIIKTIFIGIGCAGIAISFYLFIINFDKLSIYFVNNNPQGELFKVVLTSIGGLAALFVLYYTALRVRVMEKGNVEIRFNNAVGHLGSENPAVVLGGIHALHEIAVENDNYRRIVHNLFCSYLRENSAKLYEKIDFEKTPDYCPVIVQTLINYLFKPYNNRDSVYKDFKSDLSFSTLKNCNFYNLKIKNANFSHCILENCRFNFGALTGCYFRDAILKKCDFLSETLKECHFIYDEGHSAKLIDCCNVEDAKLIDTELPKNQITEK